MEKRLLGVIFALLPSFAFANYAAGELARFYVQDSGWVYFGMTVSPAGTCDNFTEQLKLDGTTPAGKNKLSTLIAAKMAGKTVNVWYTNSAAPGTNQGTGCNDSTMAVVTDLGIP